MKERKKKLTEEELKQYERALMLWELGLKKETEELDAREAEIEERETEMGCNVGTEVYGQINWEAIGRPRPVMCPKPKSVVFNDDGCTITPEEFVTTIKPCCNTCYEGGTHKADCPRMIYLEVERLGTLNED